MKKTEDLYNIIKDKPYPFFSSLAELYVVIGQNNKAFELYELYFEQSNRSLFHNLMK